MHDYISGIQQIGIGVKNAPECLRTYASLFGMDTLVFDDTSDACLMTQYTGGEVYKRQALLSLNMKGGGGFEIWQFKDRKPSDAVNPAAYGDLGIYAAKIKCGDVLKAHKVYSSLPEIQVSEIQLDEKNDPQFWVKDKYNNNFNVVTGNHWFQKSRKLVGGVTGAVIGVSDLERSLEFYKTVLNIEEVCYDKICSIKTANGTHLFRKALLIKHPTGKGAFGKLLGSMEIELVQCLDRIPQKIYANRFWGDCGFIHLCFDVLNMCGLKKYAEQQGYTFTVDSLDSFGMENASGRFCYMEDPDGTLIELVETHKVPIFKKLGLYFNLQKRNPEKPLPDWMIKLLSLSKVK